MDFFSFLKTGPLGGRGGTVYVYRTPLVGYTVKTNTTDIETVDSVYSKTIHQEMEEDHKTKSGRDEGVEKHSCQIELTGTHVNLVYYNGKQVLRTYIMLRLSLTYTVKSPRLTIVHITVEVPDTCLTSKVSYRSVSGLTSTGSNR